MSALEARLGVKLLLRTTRRVTLTDAGASFLERARRVLAELEDAEDAARGVDSLRGTIRLAIPVLYGMREVIPRLADFLRRHPQLQVELTVSDERQNLVAEGADVAIRFGRLRIPPSARAGSPSWNAIWWPRPPTSRRMADPGHRPTSRPMIAFSDPAISGGKAGPSRAPAPAFPPTSGGGSAPVLVPGALASALAGLGIAMASSVMCRDEVKRGALVILLPGFRLEPVEVHAVFPGGPHPSAKVRAFVNFLAGELAKHKRAKGKR